ncbi:MAG TPA: hypothetical protein VJA26_16415 [Gammaproteobacteria bacterium]|nr:hypothetical protein [Gammaproteobacteria bacterium]
MAYKIKLSRLWECSPRGDVLVSFSAGEYVVPDDMSDYLAQRCLRSGIGKIIDDEPEQNKQPRAANKMRRAAPENKAAS